MPRSDSLPVIVLLTLLVAFGPMSTDLYLPALPSLITAFNTSPAAIQLTLSIFLAGFAVTQLICGPLSDRFGRRPVLLGGVALFVVASTACALASTIDQLILARLVQAMGACCGPVLGRAVVRDVFGRERAATVFAYMATAMALAPALAPMLGGMLVAWPGWRASFALLAVFGLVILMATWLILPETNKHPNPDAINPGRLLANYRLLLAARQFICYTICFSGVFSSLFSFVSGSTFILIEGLNFTPFQFGMAFGLVVLGYMIGSFISGRLSLRLGVDRMILLGLGLSVSGALLGLGLALAGVTSAAAVVGPMAVLMVGAGLVLPNALAGATAPFGRMAGTASALLGFIQMVSAAGVGMVIGHYAALEATPMMVAICLTNLLAVLAFFWLIRGRRQAG